MQRSRVDYVTMFARTACRTYSPVQLYTHHVELLGHEAKDTLPELQQGSPPTSLRAEQYL